MTAKEKAEEIVSRYSDTYRMYDKKNCNAPRIRAFALIAVDEIINEWKEHKIWEPLSTFEKIKYWQEVRKEIENL